MKSFQVAALGDVVAEQVKDLLGVEVRIGTRSKYDWKRSLWPVSSYRDSELSSMAISKEVLIHGRLKQLEKGENLPGPDAVNKRK